MYIFKKQNKKTKQDSSDITQKQKSLYGCLNFRL